MRRSARTRDVVFLVHHDDMSAGHVPKGAGMEDEVFELPERVVAIERRLKGLRHTTDPEHKSLPGEAMMSVIGGDVGFGSVALEKDADAGATQQRGKKRARRRATCNGYVRRDAASTAARGSLWSCCIPVFAPLAAESDLLLVHSRSHLKKLRKFCTCAESLNAAFFPFYRGTTLVRTPSGQHDAPKTRKDADEDFFFSPGTMRAMQRAAGGAVEAVERLFATLDRKKSKRTSPPPSSFAIVRPPGHHCCGKTAAGFCLLNNTATAAAHARHVLGLERVAIVDWDYHHGDGTQSIFYDDPSVLTISMHVGMEFADRREEDKEGPDDADRYLEITYPGKPGMLFTGQHGRRKGKGYNINIPWPNRMVGRDEYLEAMRTIVCPALLGFEPQLIICASGFDAVKDDILAGTNLLPGVYYDMTRLLKELRIPMAVILEGGYAPTLIAEAAANVVSALLGAPKPKPGEEEDEESAEDCEGAAYAEDDVDEDEDEENDFDHPDYIDGLLVLNGIRRKLNKMEPWKTMATTSTASAYTGCGAAGFFFEDTSRGMAVASDRALRKLHQLMRTSLDEFEENCL